MCALVSQASLKLFGVLLVLFVVAGCGSSTEPLPLLSSDATILAFGDSLTFGTGAKSQQSYPAILENLTGRTVINAGVPGEVSSDGVRRLPREVEDAEPDLVILCHGGNDFLRKLDKQETKQNLREMLEYLREKDIPVVMLGVPDFGLFLTTADIYVELADEMGVALEADILPDLLGDNRFKSDHVHPNAAGYQQMAENIRVFLQKNGAL